MPLAPSAGCATFPHGPPGHRPSRENHLSPTATSTGITLADRIRAVTASPIALAPYLSIDGPSGPVPFELYPSQVELLRIVRRHPRVIGLKARQLGWTWALALLGLHDCIAYPTGETGIFTLDQDEANLFKWRVKRLYDSGPDWLHAVFPVAIDKADQFGIEHPEGVSSVVAFAASGESGRGRTFRRAIGDEAPRWKRKMGGPAAAQRIAAILPTVADGGSFVRLGTADGYDAHYDIWMGAAEPGQGGGNGYVRYFANALARPGRTREQVMRERRMLDGAEPGLGAQELPFTPAEAFRASGLCVFAKDALDDLAEHSIRPPLSRVDLRASKAGIVAEPHVTGAWEVWQWPVAGRSYLVAADCSGGGASSDFSSAGVYDVESWDQVAAFHGRPEPIPFAEQLILAGYLYRSADAPALLCPEKNNHGEGVIATLIARKYPRIYEQERFDQRSGTKVTSPGWTQTQHTRRVAIAALQAGVSDGSIGIRDAGTLTEMSRFIDPGDGKPRAEDGEHDDRVMQTAIAAAVLSFSRRPTAPAPRRPRKAYTPRVSAKSGY